MTYSSDASFQPLPLPSCRGPQAQTRCDDTVATINKLLHLVTRRTLNSLPARCLGSWVNDFLKARATLGGAIVNRNVTFLSGHSCVLLLLLLLSLTPVQDGETAGPAAGDAKALGLMAEMEAGDWGQGWLTEADRSGAASTMW